MKCRRISEKEILNNSHTEIKSFPEYEIIDQTYFKREHSKKYM